jgi:DMSO/TMAO reductase YedYZ molybdopterin-dependent catalytic subunit
MGHHPKKGEPTMNSRRKFLRLIIGLFAGISLFFSPIAALFRKAYALMKKILLPKGTQMSSLVDKNPATLDTRNLEVIPLKEFGTMGLADYQVDLEQWRLEVVGQVKTPLKLSYQQLRDLPVVERKVLLICPGVFANYGKWKGISIGYLLKTAKAQGDITHVVLRGPSGTYEKVEQFPMAAIVSDKVFLAYQVNGQDLPREHGFPLRVVAEDYYGYTWVKYVYKVEAYKAQE